MLLTYESHPVRPSGWRGSSFGVSGGARACPIDDCSARAIQMQLPLSASVRWLTAPLAEQTCMH